MCLDLYIAITFPTNTKSIKLHIKNKVLQNIADCTESSYRLEILQSIMNEPCDAEKK